MGSSNIANWSIRDAVPEDIPDILQMIKIEIIFPSNKMEKLEDFLSEHGGKITAGKPLQVQDTCLQCDEQSDSNALTGTNDVLDTAQISGEVLHLLQRGKIPISQFGLHVLERSQGRTSELLNRPKSFENLSKEGRVVYRQMKEWLAQKDPVGDIRGKLQVKRKRGLTSSSCTAGRTKFSELQRVALEALYKDAQYPTQGVLEEFARLNNLEPRTVKVWFNNKRQRGNNAETTQGATTSAAENVRDLAVFEKEPESIVKITKEEMLRDGFGENPWFGCVIAEELQLSEENDCLPTKRPVGCAVFFNMYSTWDGRSLFLQDLYVKPNSRGKGIGTALLKKVSVIAIERKCARVDWNVLHWNKIATDFYDNLGAICLGEWRLYRLTGDRLLEFAGKN